MRSVALLAALALAITACAPKPSLDEEVQIAVAQTLAAIPTATAYPTPFPRPTPTAASLAGLFCEYQFCIGHPVDVAFTDVDAQRDPLAPSNFSQGILAAYNPGLFIQVIWQDATGASDAAFMIDTILTGATDTKSGNVTAFQTGNLKVFYVPIASTAAAVLPNGAAAAWLCGGRAFAWKTYTPQADLARNLLNEALQKFRCNNP
jgi:hypothetical protein